MIRIALLFDIQSQLYYHFSSEFQAVVSGHSAQALKGIEDEQVLCWGAGILQR